MFPLFIHGKSAVCFSCILSLQWFASVAKVSRNSDYYCDDIRDGNQHVGARTTSLFAAVPAARAVLHSRCTRLLWMTPQRSSNFFFYISLHKVLPLLWRSRCSRYRISANEDARTLDKRYYGRSAASRRRYFKTEVLGQVPSGCKTRDSECSGINPWVNNSRETVGELLPFAICMHHSCMRKYIFRALGTSLDFASISIFHR